jgi:hypothetical protein
MYMLQYMYLYDIYTLSRASFEFDNCYIVNRTLPLASPVWTSGLSFRTSGSRSGASWALSSMRSSAQQHLLVLTRGKMRRVDSSSRQLSRTPKRNLSRDRCALWRLAVREQSLRAAAAPPSCTARARAATASPVLPLLHLCAVWLARLRPQVDAICCCHSPAKITIEAGRAQPPLPHCSIRYSC